MLPDELWPHPSHSDTEVWFSSSLECGFTWTVRSLGWILNHYVWWYLRRGSVDTDKRRQTSMWRHREKITIYKPQKKPAPSTTWSQPSDLHNCDKMNLLFRPPHLWCYVVAVLKLICPDTQQLMPWEGLVLLTIPAPPFWRWDCLGTNDYTKSEVLCKQAPKPSTSFT